jgi:hypothetical protein
MQRRTFLYWLFCVATARRATAQTSNLLRKIGYFHPATIDPDSPLVSMLRPGWRQLGYVEGETILLRTAHGDIARLPALTTRADS